jgi:hypothetical protein
MGISIRLQKLMENATSSEKDTLFDGYKRIVGDMGHQYSVLGLNSEI